MEFKLTKETLSRLSEKEVITVRDIMGLMTDDICKDLQNEGCELSKLPFGDAEDAIPWICRLSRMIAKIYKNNQEYFLSDDYRSIWEGAEGKLSEAQEKLELLEQDVLKNRNALEELRNVQEQIQENQKEIEEYQELSAREEQKRKEKEELETQCRTLQQKISVLERESIPVVRASLEQLELKKSEMDQEWNSIKEQDNELQEKLQKEIGELEQQKERADQLQQEVANKKTQIENLKLEYQNSISENEKLRGELTKLQIQIQDQKNIDESLRLLAEKNKAPYEDFLNKQALLRSLFRELKSDLTISEGCFVDFATAKQLCNAFQERLERTQELMEQYEKLLRYIEKGEH